MEAEAIKVRARELNSKKHPDLQRVRSLVLREGPRSKVELTFTIIQDRHTKEYHHDALAIKSYKKIKGVWQPEPTKSIGLNSDKIDELGTLIDFIQVNRTGSVPEKNDDYIVLNAPENFGDAEALNSLLNDVHGEDKVDALVKIIDGAATNEAMFDILLDRVSKNPKLFAEAAAALNLATYINALQDLRDLVESQESSENQFQKILEDNPWMFGSEYSELLLIRKLTRNEEQDFILRCTTDNYIELVEIKTPLPNINLFNHDKSHDSYYQSAEVSKVLGQVQNYLEQIDAERHTIKARDGEDPLKVRAKIIIGRDGDDEQKRALRRLNGHLHRIEIITFDQLLSIAQRVVNYLETAIRPQQEELSDLPF